MLAVSSRKNAGNGSHSCYSHVLKERSSRTYRASVAVVPCLQPRCSACSCGAPPGSLDAPPGSLGAPPEASVLPLQPWCSLYSLSAHLQPWCFPCSYGASPTVSVLHLQLQCSPCSCGAFPAASVFPPQFWCSPCSCGASPTALVLPLQSQCSPCSLGASPAASMLSLQLQHYSAALLRWLAISVQQEEISGRDSETGGGGCCPMVSPEGRGDVKFSWLSRDNEQMVDTLRLAANMTAHWELESDCS